MRITNKSLVRNYLNDLNTNLHNMSSLQEQLSSGKELSKPSDNPFKVARVMELRTSISANDRYKTNIQEGAGWLQTTDDALSQLNDSLQRVRELTVAGGNGTYSTTERDAIKQEITQIKSGIVQIGNTVYDGRYVFGGDKTTSAPFDDSGAYAGSATGLVREFSPGVTMDIGTTGDKFQGVFSTLDKIMTDLSNNKSPSGNLAELDTHIDNELILRAKAGANAARLEAMSSKNESETYNMTELLSKTEDIDIAQKYMEYSVMENVYNSSLQTGAKILQKSLLDFLS